MMTGIIQNVRRIYFPYCMEKQKDNSWVLLNRDYKPVGFNTDEYIEYDQHPVSIKIERLGEKTLQKLSYKGESSKRVYLYHDGCIPTDSVSAMSAYLKKIEILLKFETYL